MKQTSGHIIVQFKNLITPFFTILHHKTCPFRSRELSLEHEDRKRDFKRKQPGTPERERFREEARTYVNGHTKTAECRNSQKKQK